VDLCLRTYHIFAAGYPIETREGCRETMKAFDDLQELATKSTSVVMGRVAPLRLLTAIPTSGIAFCAGAGRGRRARRRPERWRQSNRLPQLRRCAGIARTIALGVLGITNSAVDFETREMQGPPSH
jgi:hypothetical protein